MRTNSCHRLIALAALSCVAIPAATRAALVNWTGTAANNEWLDAGNWSSTPNLPVEGLGATGDEIEINTDVNHPIFDAADGTRTYEYIRVGYTGTNITGRLDVTGGTLTADDTDQVRIGRGAGRIGIINVSGGTFNAGGIVQIGMDPGGTGFVNISGGRFNANRNATADGVSSVSVILGDNASTATSGTLDLSGGELYTRTGLSVGHSGGGKGLFHVNGGTGTAHIGDLNTTDSGFWVQRASGTLKATVDSAGFTLGTISIFDNGTANSYVQFDAGSVLDLGFSGAAPQSTMSWDLMTFADGITLSNGLVLAPEDVAAGWSFELVDTGGTSAPNALRVTYTIPEPASLSALAALALLSRRRRG